MRSAFDALCKHMDITPQIVQEVLSVRSACRLVSRGLGATFLFDVPQELAYLSKEANCYYIDAEDLTIDFLIACDKKRPIERACKKIIREIQEAIKPLY